MINIEQVSKRYDDQLAVDCLSLKIIKGEIFGLLGPNGAGKSTLVNMMCGILKSDQGDITLGDYHIEKEPLKAKKLLGMVPQDLALFDNMTVLQNLKYFGELYGLKKEPLKQAIAEALDLSKLEDYKNKKVKKLSGGMKRRLNIACSTLHKPDILILDEPTVGIDPQSRNHIMEVVQKLNKEHKTTVIYITHYMEEVEKLCHRLAIVGKGKLIIEGTKSFIISSLSHDQHFKILCKTPPAEAIELLKSNPNILGLKDLENGIEVNGTSSLTFTELSKALEKAQITIESLSMHTPDLEWAFLKLTGRALRDA